MNPSLNFRSKIKLELKAHQIDPRVCQILDECRQKLEALQEERNTEIDEF
jgi:hypothetical protein